MRRLGVTALCALVGCGGGAIPYENLNSELFRALCQIYAKCGVVRSEAACNADYEGLVIGSDYSEAIASGKIRYDGAAARSCINALSGATCALTSLEGDPSCEKVYEGTVAVGSACATSTECVSSAYCEVTTTGQMCSGACRARVGEGGAATSSTQCEQGLRIADGKCVKPPAEGEACTQATSCASGLVCGSDLKCRKLAAKGEACDSNTNRCTSLYTCVNSVCRELLDVGETCGTSGLSCKFDLFCDSASKTCKEPGGEGATCSSNAGCKEPLKCAGSTCRPPVSEGQSCSASAPCDDATYCDSTCKKRLAAGQPCTSSSQCETNHTCSSGACKSIFTACP